MTVSFFFRKFRGKPLRTFPGIAFCVSFAIRTETASRFSWNCSKYIIMSRVRNQIARRALLGMRRRKPNDTPRWWPKAEERQAMCCSFCGGRDHRYEECPQRDISTDPPVVPPGEAEIES